MQFTSFTSIRFILFLLLVAAVDFALPRKLRSKWLFAVSLVFYACLDLRFLPLLLIVILTAWLGGRAIEADRLKAGIPEGAGAGSSMSFAVSVLVETGILVLFRSAGFFADNLQMLKNALHGGNAAVQAGSRPDIFLFIVPIGISFYILQAIGYLIDVKRGTVPAEKDPVTLGLFIAFFPQLTSGPIERAGHMLPQFRKGPEGFDPDRIRDGALTMLWGYFLKMVIADRAALLPDTLYRSPESYGGAVTLLVIILYCFQLYCDFAGYSAIAIGAGRVLGVDLIENFRSPFLSGSLTELWRRWHISLSSWLKDYIYIPLGGNRKGTARKYLNILLVFAVSGFWHGAAWTCIVWGLLQGILQIIGRLMMPVRDALVSAFHVDRRSFSHRAAKTVFTFMMFVFTFVFFRAPTMKAAVQVFTNLFEPRLWELTGGKLMEMGAGMPDMVLLALSLGILVFADIAGYRGIRMQDRLKRQSLPFRWIVYIAAVLLIAVCGMWGPGYSAASFIYAHF